MRRNILFAMLITGALTACGGDDEPSRPFTYQLVAPTRGTVTVRQDRTISLRDSGLVIQRDDDFILPGNGANPVSQPNPRLTFIVEDSDIALVDPFGIVRGIKPGITSVTAKGYDADVTFNVEVTPYKATEVILRVLTGPTGTLITPSSARPSSGIMYALPADRQSSVLEGLVLVGTDTVFCNRCNVKNAAAGGPRVQRFVTFRSLNPAMATISNSADPFTQSTDATPRRTDTTGRVTAFDTSSTPVKFVMESPGDEMADTVEITFQLRPIDRIIIDADSADFPPTVIADLDDFGMVRRKYPFSDSLSGNFSFAATPAFAVRADYWFTVRRPSNFGAQTNANPTHIRMLDDPDEGPEEYRPNRPIVDWLSALPSYLQLVPSANNKAVVTGPCNFISATCFSPASQAVRDGMVLVCSDNEAQLPGLNAGGNPNGGSPLLFGGVGTYSIVNCVPPKTIPMPGAFCTTASSTDPTSFCTIWVRATTTDPATGAALVDLYRVNVRR